MDEVEKKERQRLGRILAEAGHGVDVMSFDSIEQLEAEVRARVAWLHGWYEGTLRHFTKSEGTNG